MQIENLIRELGINDYQITGDEAKAPCPFHSPDRHPSWYINLRSGLYHCFSCGARGNLAHLVSFTRHIRYPEAVIWVNERIGWAKADRWREHNVEESHFNPPSLKINETDLALFTDPPQQALDDRGITIEESHRFGVRYAPANNSWILPIRDPYTNELWGWQEKFIDTRLFRNYPSGIKKSKTLFGLDAFTDGSTAILVESPIDAVRVSSFGAGSGLSSWGVSFSSFQQSLIHERTEHLILALDNDHDGIRETTRIAREFSQVRVSVFSYEHVSVKDPGEMNDIDIMLGFANMRTGLWWLNERQKRL